MSWNYLGATALLCHIYLQELTPEQLPKNFLFESQLIRYLKMLLAH
jgi:hypothetical protein